MPPIFISYRREDTPGEARLLCDALTARYGSASVFMDVAAIGYGGNFRKEIDKSIKNCGVLLTLIGKTWLDQKNDAGHIGVSTTQGTSYGWRRRLRSSWSDPSCLYLSTAPKCPRPDQLPEDLQELADLNAFELTHVHWSSDVGELIKALDPYVKGKPPKRPPEPRKGWWSVRRALGLFLLIVLVVWISSAIWQNGQDPPQWGNGQNTMEPRANFDDTATVPQVEGLSLLAAETTLQTAGLAEGKVKWVKTLGVAPGTVVDASKKPGEQVDRGTKINLKVAKSDGTDENVSPQPTGTQSVPNFAGTWTCFEGTDKGGGVSCGAGTAVLTQNGSTVHWDGRDIPINQNGVATHQEFYVQDGNTCHQVQSSNGAYRINTTSLWIEGTTLTYETVFDNVKPYCGDPVGKESIVFRYHR